MTAVKEILANAIAPAIKIGAIVIVVVGLSIAIYFLVPKPVQEWIMAHLEWIWSKSPLGK